MSPLPGFKINGFVRFVPGGLCAQGLNEKFNKTFCSWLEKSKLLKSIVIFRYRRLYLCVIFHSHVITVTGDRDWLPVTVVTCKWKLTHKYNLRYRRILKIFFETLNHNRLTKEVFAVRPCLWVHRAFRNRTYRKELIDNGKCLTNKNAWCHKLYKNKFL